jgi:hypothetical protein
MHYKLYINSEQAGKAAFIGFGYFVYGISCKIIYYVKFISKTLLNAINSL